MTIWKWTIPVTDEWEVEMPVGAQVIAADAETMDRIDLWAIVDPDADTETRHFIIHGTGHPLHEDATKDTHVATTRIGPLAWHVFDVTPVKF